MSHMVSNRIEVHFLNVDHGDCTIIRHSGDEHREKGRITFIDINNWNDRREEDEKVAGLSWYLKKSVQLSSGAKTISPEEYAEKYLDDPLDYFNQNVREPDQDIWRFIATHPDMDHLSGIKRLDSEEEISIFWDTEHEKEMDGWNGSPYNQEDWERYQKIRNEKFEHDVLKLNSGQEGKFWEHDNIEILHPSEEFMEEFDEEKGDPEYNDISYVLLLKTRAANFLFPGDIGEDVWEILIEDHRSKLESVDILKASHHGRESGFHKEAVEVMDPDYVILSVGNKPDNDAHGDYVGTCSGDAQVLSTRQHGWIKFWIPSPERRETIFGPNMNVEEGIFELPDE